MQQFFGDFTVSPGRTYGELTNTKSKKYAPDKCREFRVALEKHDEQRLRAFVRVLCDKFDQVCIYLVSGSDAQFIDCNETVESDAYRGARTFLRIDGSKQIVSTAFQESLM